jgi:cytochrome c556
MFKTEETTVRATGAMAAGIIGLLLGAAGLTSTVGQNSPLPDQTALTSQGETTVARRLLMNSIGANNDIIHDILDGALPMDDLELRGRLQSISSMLYAFPSLYRAEANPYSEAAEKADAARVSLASPAVWEDFETFKLLAYDAYYKAQEAADAPSGDILARVEELEAMCEGCHDAFPKPFAYFDFDRIEDFLTQ